MRRLLLALAFSAAPVVADAPPPAPPAYNDLSQAFVNFWDHTQGLDADARVAAFKVQIAPLFPAFYAPHDGQTQQQRDADIRDAIAQFPVIRARFIAARQASPAAYAGAQAHFAHYFPGSKAGLPVYFLHSLGEMDGGTRSFGSHDVMIFGADGIALYDTPADIGPLMDHELTHVENAPYFKDCDQMWCHMWVEGLAVAATEVMNPGISQHGLLLESPRPIAAAVEAHWRAAVCKMRDRRDSASNADMAAMFTTNGGDPLLPPRWGYYMGWKLVRRALRHHSIQQLVHMPNAPAHDLVIATLNQMANQADDCPSGS